MSRRAAMLAVLCVALLPQVALADDYRPVSCNSAKPYAGPPLHPAVALPQIAGDFRATLPPATVAALDQAFDKALAATSAPAMTATVAVPGQGIWTRTAPAGSTPLFFWASAGKAYTAAVILQMVEEGRLSLSDPVANWIRDVPNGEVVTVRDLLAHTGGLFSANEDLRARAEHRAHTLTEDLRILARHGAMSCPGERWRYSNTGYALLGAIVEAVDGRPYQAAIEARILAPLGLTRTRVLKDDAGTDIAALVSAKEPPIAPYWAGAAGPIVATSEDTVRFWAALLGGKLLKPATLQVMFGTLYPMFDAGTFYGLGAMVYEVPGSDGANRLWLGHAGGTPGAGAVAFYAPADRAFVAVALTGDGSATATANLLLRQLPAR